jgi:hypothetical protein
MPHVFVEQGGTTATFFTHQTNQIQSSTDAKFKAKLWRHVVVRLQTVEPH